jgi:hypothetical protein
MAAATQTATTQAAVATLPQGSINMPGVLVWFVAWGMVLGVLYGISRTRAGHTITYYVLWLSVVLVLVSHGGEISSILAQGNITQGQS